MSDPFENTINTVLEQINGWETEIAPTLVRINDAKATVNGLCKLSGRDLLFPETAGLGAAPKPTPAAVTPKDGPTIKVDQFTSMGLATAVQAVLEMRAKHAGGTSPATVDQIHEALIAGGFNFPSKDVENQKRGLAVSLAKNSYSFRRIGKDLIGLVSWYGPAPRKARKADAPNGNEKPTATEQDAAREQQSEEEEKDD